MSNPFMNYSSGSGSANIKVNNIKTDIRSNIVVPISSLSDVSITTPPTSSQVLFYNG